MSKIPFSTLPPIAGQPPQSPLPAIKPLTPPPQTLTLKPPMKGQMVDPSGKPLSPQASYSMLAQTGAIIAAQSGAFALLNIYAPQNNRTNQFGENTGINAFPEYDPAEGISKLGTPIYGKIVLGDTERENIYTDAQGRQGSYQTVELDCALVNVEFNNRIVSTNIQGLGQTIKEFISSGDNDVTITGIYNSTPGVAPIDFIINMGKIFSAPVPIPVNNYYLNNLNIFYIVIMPGTTMGQQEGGYATQTFTIKAVSDVPMLQMLP